MSSDRVISDEKLIALGEHIVKGLTSEEAFILEELTEVQIKFLKASPEFSRYIKKYEIEFKKKHLENINKKSDPKTSQWLLERLRSNEFGSKKANEAPETVNIITTIIKNIQQNKKDEPIKIHEAKIQAYQINPRLIPGDDKDPESINEILK